MHIECDSPAHPFAAALVFERIPMTHRVLCSRAVDQRDGEHRQVAGTEKRQQCMKDKQRRERSVLDMTATQRPLEGSASNTELIMGLL